MNLLRIWLIEVARWLYWFPLRLIVHLLPMRLIYMLGWVAGMLFYYTVKEKRRALLSGINKIYGNRLRPKEIKRIVRRTFDHNAKNALETLLCDRLDKKLVEKMIAFEGLNNLFDALSLGKGVIIMHGHFGNEELIMPAVGIEGFQMNQLASRWAPEPLKGWFVKIPDLIRQKIFKLKISIRERYPIKFIYIDRFLREAFECLKRNEILTIAIDGREGEKWIGIDFLGKKGLFSPGPMNIAVKTKAPVIPVFILRDKGNKHKLIFHRPFTLAETGNREKDILCNTQRFIQLIEEYVDKYPCHYMKMFWVKSRFFID